MQQSATDLKSFSKAELGDKTMLDALFPFVDTLESEVGGGAGARSRLADGRGGLRRGGRGHGFARPQDRPGPATGRAQRRHP